jgi:hypothetical protein
MNKTSADKSLQASADESRKWHGGHLPAWLFWIVGVLLITWFITGQERKGVYFSWYDASMNNSINVNGLRFRLLEDGSLLLTTPTGQYQIQAPGVADLFDLLSAGQGGFLDASSDLPT